MTSITLRIPAAVGKSLKTIAPPEGFGGYHALLKAYLSEGLRRDEAIPVCGPAARVAEALKKRGVSVKLIAEAAQEASPESSRGRWCSSELYDQARLHGVTRVPEVSSPQTEQHRTASNRVGGPVSRMTVDKTHRVLRMLARCSVLLLPFPNGSCDNRLLVQEVTWHCSLLGGIGSSEADWLPGLVLTQPTLSSLCGDGKAPPQ